MRLLSAAVCACLMLAGPPSLAEQAPRTYVMAGFDGRDTWRTWSENSFFSTMSELTGIRFSFVQYDDEKAWTSAKEGMAAGGDSLPDALFKAALSPAECMDMLGRGVLIDLKPYLGEHCPNLTRLLERNPQFKQAITLPGGAVAALPFINLAPAQNCMWINRQWLETLGLSMPRDATGLKTVLEAFRDGDPNRNGRRDEIPLVFQGAYDLKYLAHAFGMAANDFNVYASDGKAFFMPEDAGFMPFLLWCRDLYRLGLIDRDGFSSAASFRRVTDAKSTPRYGVILSPLSSYVVPPEWAADYTVIPPLTHEGRQVYRSIAGQVTTGTFALTSACENPGELLSWADRLYSEQGAILAVAGREGVDYVIDGDGTWRRTESASQPSFLSDVSIMTGVTPPGLSSDGFQRRMSDPLVRALSEQVDIVSALAADPFPAFSLTREQEDRVAPLQAAIGRYVDESIARWVTGEWELNDAQTEAFHLELDRLGLDAFMAFWQQILDALEE